MTASRTGFLALGAAFVSAEILRPTKFVVRKRTVAGGLLLRSQRAPTGAADTLEPELLDDLPRIHPDALGTLAVERNARGAVTALHGLIADPYTRTAGIAVFPIVRGKRISSARTIYGLSRHDDVASDPAAILSARFRIELSPPEVADAASIGVGLIALDRRGYFLLGPNTADSVTISSRL